MIKRIYSNLDIEVLGKREESYIEYEGNYMNYILVFAENNFNVERKIFIYIFFVSNRFGV